MRPFKHNLETKSVRSNKEKEGEKESEDIITDNSKPEKNKASDSCNKEEVPYWESYYKKEENIPTEDKIEKLKDEIDGRRRKRWNDKIMLVGAAAGIFLNMTLSVGYTIPIVAGGLLAGGSLLMNHTEKKRIEKINKIQKEINENKENKDLQNKLERDIENLESLQSIKSAILGSGAGILGGWIAGIIIAQIFVQKNRKADKEAKSKNKNTSNN